MIKNNDAIQILNNDSRNQYTIQELYILFNISKDEYVPNVARLLEMLPLHKIILVSCFGDDDNYEYKSITEIPDNVLNNIKHMTPIYRILPIEELCDLGENCYFGELL
jgi:hypothetical protein